MTNILKPPDCIYCESQPHDVCPCSCSHAPCLHTLNGVRAERDELLRQVDDALFASNHQKILLQSYIQQEPEGEEATAPVLERVHTALLRLRAERDEERELARRGIACHGVTALDRDKAEAELAKLRALDDPDMDATDGAHPAWWRGHDHTAKVFGEKVSAWLRGEDDLRGSMSEPWQTIRAQIAGLVAYASRAKTPAYLGDDPELLKRAVHKLVGALRGILAACESPHARPEHARAIACEQAIAVLAEIEGEGTT